MCWFDLAVSVLLGGAVLAGVCAGCSAHGGEVGVYASSAVISPVTASGASASQTGADSSNAHDDGVLADAGSSRDLEAGARELMPGARDGGDGGTQADWLQCVPDCGARLCGDDGCGGVCGTCPDGSRCNVGSGSCE